MAKGRAAPHLGSMAHSPDSWTQAGTPVSAPRPFTRRPSVILLVATVVAAGCEAPDRQENPTPDDPPATTVLTGARVITGTGDVFADGVLVVEAGRIRAVGGPDTPIPAGALAVDLSGRTLVAGLINAHGHVAGTRGLEAGHYTRENLERQLRLYAAYGITTVVSLGGDGREGVRLRDEQSTPAPGRARVFVAGEVVTGDTPAAAIEAVERNLALGVDFMKIRVDDNLGSTTKMTPEVYRAVIARSHEAGVPLAAHVFYREDAADLLDAGADLIAHSVRDRAVDAPLIQQFLDTGVCYVPTLTREVSTFVYAGEPDFFSDPFFLRHADPTVLEALRDPARQASVRGNPASAAYEAALEIATRNLGVLSDAGVTIALGTDTGPPARFQGYFEHMEMDLMAEAGLSAEQILRAGTRDAARCLGLEDVGTLQEGAWADFLVLSADPLEDHRTLRSIEAVWVGGAPIDGL